MKDYEKLEKELEQLKEIEKEHQRINGSLHLEIKELKEKYMKLEDKYIHNVSCCNEEDCDLFCEHQELKLELSGYRQAILEDKDMLGLKEENKKYKEVIDNIKKIIIDNSYNELYECFNELIEENVIEIVNILDIKKDMLKRWNNE